MNVRRRTPDFIAYSLPLLVGLLWPGALGAQPVPGPPAPTTTAPVLPPAPPPAPTSAAPAEPPALAPPPSAVPPPPGAVSGQATDGSRTAVLDASRTNGHASSRPPTAPVSVQSSSNAPGSVDPLPPAAPVSPRAANDIRVVDAHPDRVVLLPTAETHPEGTVYLSSYEIVIPQVGYAISDRTQITLTSTPPFGEDLAFLSDLSLKTVIVRDRRVRFAAIGSVSGLFGLEGESFLLGRAGAVAQGCFDAACRSSVSLGSTFLLAGPVTMNASGVGLVWRATTALSFLLEAQTLLPLGREAGAVNGVGIAPGIRLGWSRFSMDFAAEILPEAEVDGDAAPPVVPFIALTYRFLPSADAATP